jgi:rhamnose transport system substrate-binding protein
MRVALALLLTAGVLAGCSPPPPTTGTGTAPGNTGSSGATSTGGSGSSASSGPKIKIGMMPKQKGIPYFNACQKGAEEAAKELGDVELTYDGPVEGKSEDQSQMLETWVTRKLDAVAVACNDPSQISAALKHAKDEGLAVVTYDADADPAASERDLFVNQADEQQIAEALVDEMATQAGENAQVGIVSSTKTAPNQVAWIKAMDAYMKSKYPKMRVVVTEYPGEDQPKCVQKAQDILKVYPDVKGIFGLSSVAFPGAAQAVQQAGKSGKVAVVGLGTPKSMKDFVEQGVVKAVILWKPVDLGYLAVYVARAVKKGELKKGDTSFTAGRLGPVTLKGDVVLLGKPMRFDKTNIAQYDF